VKHKRMPDLRCWRFKSWCSNAVSLDR